MLSLELVWEKKNKSSSARVHSSPSKTNLFSWVPLKGHLDICKGRYLGTWMPSLAVSKTKSFQLCRAAGGAAQNTETEKRQPPVQGCSRGPREENKWEPDKEIEKKKQGMSEYMHHGHMSAHQQLPSPCSKTSGLTKWKSWHYLCYVKEPGS